jgi:hypothetical protein
VVGRGDPWDTIPALRAEKARLRLVIDARRRKAAADKARHDSKVNLADDIYRKRSRKGDRAPYTGPLLNTILEQSNSAASEPSIPAGEDDDDDDSSPTRDDDSPAVDDDSSPMVDDDSSLTRDDDKPAVPPRNPAHEDMASAEWRTEVVAGPPSNIALSSSSDDNPGHNALRVVKQYTPARPVQQASGGGNAAINPPPMPT